MLTIVSLNSSKTIFSKLNESSKNLYNEMQQWTVLTYFCDEIRKWLLYLFCWCRKKSSYLFCLKRKGKHQSFSHKYFMTTQIQNFIFFRMLTFLLKPV